MRRRGSRFIAFRICSSRLSRNLARSVERALIEFGRLSGAWGPEVALSPDYASLSARFIRGYSPLAPPGPRPASCNLDPPNRTCFVLRRASTQLALVHFRGSRRSSNFFCFCAYSLHPPRRLVADKRVDAMPMSHDRPLDFEQLVDEHQSMVFSLA